MATRKPERRRVNWGRVTVAVLLMVLAVLIIAGAIWLATSSADTDGSDRAALLGVSEITVEGASHYSDEQIVAASGVKAGQSVFSLNKREAAENILRGCPYVARVTVETRMITTLKITVEETKTVGYWQDAGRRWLIGGNGKLLESVSGDSDRADGLHRLHITPPTDPVAGTAVLDSEAAACLVEVLEAMDTYWLNDITEIEVIDPAAIRLLWKDRIVIELKGTQDLTHQIGVAAAAMPSVFESYGTEAVGRLRMSPYDGASAVYAPLGERPVLGQPDTPETTTAPTTAPTTGATDDAATEPTKIS